MKPFLLLTFVLAANFSSATNYYISSTGNDANAGTSASAPWKSISKVNSFSSSLAPGDSILFKSGETFYGALSINKSGTSTSPIVISSFGTGARPVISALTDVTGWVSLGGNLWRSSAITNVKNLNIVTVDGVSVAMGRYPNADAPSKGYLYFEAVSGKTAVTDNELPSSPNWTGAEIVLKPNPWTIGEYPISGHSGTTLTFTGNTTVIRNNYGYFIQNSISTLDQQNEWFFDKATKQMTMYSTAAPANIKASTIDTLVFINSRNYITLQNLEFKGANQEAISLSVTTGIKVDGCNINNSGTNGVRARASVSPVIQNNIFRDNNNSAVELADIGNSNAIVKNNKISRTGSVPGKGDDLKAINLTGSGHLIEANTIDSTGFVAIYFTRGSNITIKNNVINTFCYVKSDGGGIYTWNNDLTPTTYTNNKIIGNIVLNGVGATEGTPGTIPDVDGIYMDDNTSNVDILDNTVSNVAGSGMYIHNNFNMNIQRNTLFGNLREQLNFTHNLAYVNGVLASYTTPLRNITLKNNVIVSRLANQTVFTASSIRNDMDSTGVTDSNYYARPIEDNITMDATVNVSGTSVTTTYSVASWKAAFHKDAASKKSPMVVPPYTINSYATANLFANGQYTSSVSGTSVYSPNGNQSIAWDNTGKIAAGTLKVAFPTPVPNVYTSLYSSVGAVSSSKSYILRFTTLGTSDSGSLRVYLRKTASPYNTLSSIMSKSFSKNLTTHEFLFTAPSDEAAASILIEFKQNSGTTYIDNVEFYQANITMTNIDDYLKFVYNTTASPVTLPLPNKYIGFDSTVYNGSITLQPFSSKVLLKSGPISGVLPVTLTDFSAKNSNDKIQVEWKTQTEVNSSHYIVERSSNGIDFESVGTVNSLNNINRQSSYSLTDEVPFKGVSFYRLAMVDKDGTIVYSKTVSVTVKSVVSFAVSQLSLSAANSNIKISLNSASQQSVNLLLVDVNGRKILSAPLNIQKGMNNIEKTIPVINTGIYYVKVFTNDLAVSKPVFSQQ